MAENIQILRIRLGVYRLYSVAGNEGMNVTAQDMRDISDWCLRNMSVLEQEARHIEPNEPTTNERQQS